MEIEKQKSILFLQYIKTKSGRKALGLRLANKLWPGLRILSRLYRRYILKRVKFIVVVGSLGKTTTTSAIKCVLGQHISGNLISNAFSNF